MYRIRKSYVYLLCRALGTVYKSSETFHDYVDDTEFVAMFEQRVQVHYTSTLSDMILLTNKFINSNRKAAWLVAALLELIINDISINDNDIFYLGDGHTLKKVELKMLNEINLQPFLLSIWHYIIMNAQCQGSCQ